MVENKTPTKRVLELSLDISHIADRHYEPGDTIAILPHNTDESVEKLLKAMQLEEALMTHCSVCVRQTCTKKSAKVPLYIPEITTPHEILRDCLNLHAVPKKLFLRALAECCSSTDERNFLNCLSSKEATSLYDELILKKGFTLLELLSLCPSCKPTISLLVEHLPRLLPRPYSIANSPLKHTNDIRIIFSILAEKPGVTTNMLNTLGTSILQTPIKDETVCLEQAKILMYLRDTNRFRFTAEEAISNQILISIGTGLAPFLGFLEHKHELSKQSLALGETWLFTGATVEASILQRTQLLQWQQAGTLNKYFESLSRVPDAPYHYVQDQLLANAEEFVNMLMLAETILYICADGAEISKSLELAISQCMQEQLKIEAVQAKEMLKEFRANGKYREDLWL